MLSADDPQTVNSLRSLKETIDAGERPFAIWVGAGASRWLGYPSWKDLALSIRSQFYKAAVPGFDNQRALDCLNREDYPAFFELCKQVDPPRYRTILANEFLPKPDTRIYSAFLQRLTSLAPLFVLTTDVDGSLESRMPSLAVIERSDFARAITLLQAKTPFIAKLHGSISAIETVVFTSSDYKRLTADDGFLDTLRWVFTTCSVVFLGYGVRDAYVVNLLERNAAHLKLFGPGPHFVVTNDQLANPSLHPIRYGVRVSPDHRAALTVIDVMRQEIEWRRDLTPQPASIAVPRPETSSKAPETTAYYISDFKPPGTWHTSQTAQIESPTGTKLEMTVGLGFTNDEIPWRDSTAVHDFAVGLTCFDYIYLPLQALGAVHGLFGSEIFWEVIDADVLRFVHMLHEPAIIFHAGGIIGDLGMMSLRDSEGAGPQSIAEVVRRHLHPVPGKEQEAGRLFESLESKTVTYEEAMNIGLPSMTRNALLMPGISRMLGISDAILPTQVPRWLVFPYLRLAHLVHTGAVCAAHSLRAAKLPFGGAQLANAAFGVQPAAEYAEEFASYIYSGNFNSDLGALLLHDLSLVRRILKFRKSSEGERFRAETRDRLVDATASEFAASVNAGLARSIPLSVLQKAHDRLSGLLTQSLRVTPVSAVWTNLLHSDNSTQYWRGRSLKMLADLCKEKGIRKDDPCICGSGDKLRICCPSIDSPNSRLPPLFAQQRVGMQSSITRH